MSDSSTKTKAPMRDYPPNSAPTRSKQSELDLIPQNWDVASIGDLNPFVTSGSRGWARYYSEVGAPFIRITNLRRESIYLDLSDLKYVTLPPGACAEASRTGLQDGDLLISITADIGIIGFVDSSVPKPAYMNQHVALVRFDKSQISGQFVAYALASERPQQLFIRSMDIGAKAGMNLLTVRSIEVPVPPLSEQRAIAEALSDVDALIRALAELIAKKRAIKQAAMQQLLTGKTRLPGFSREWRTVYLRDLLSYERPDQYIVRHDEYSEHGDIPVLTANKSFFLGYTNEDFGICRELPVIVFDDFTTDSKYADFPFKVKSSAIKLLRPRHDRVDLRFIFERMQLIRFPLGGHKRHFISGYQNLELAAPDYEEQKAIATVLSDMDSEIVALTRRSDKTKLIKQGMVQSLLTGRVRLVAPTEAESQA